MVNAEPDISVIIACYNEAENIEPLSKQLCDALQPTGKAFEIIYVDDASTDNTLAEINRVSGIFPQVKAAAHIRNFGQSAAILTGLAVSTGPLVITLDADMQNDPADIPRMLELIQNADAVCGVRTNRKDSWTKLVSSRIANRVRAAILHDNVTDAGCAFRVIRRSALKQLPAFRALHRFLPTILKINGFRVVEMPVDHHARRFGISKYGVGNRLFVGIYDMFAIQWYRRRTFPVHRTNPEDKPNKP
jgi:glycosyltransferase involved in cell wall biosynthesis